MKRIVFIVLVAAFLWSCATTPMDDEEFLELVKTGSFKEVNKAIQNGADVNAKDESGKTPMMYVAEYGESPEVLQLLIDAGADVQVQNKEGHDAFNYIERNEALFNSDAYWNMYKLKY
jgi:ankyrin repeat protein